MQKAWKLDSEIYVFRINFKCFSENIETFSSQVVNFQYFCY